MQEVRDLATMLKEKSIELGRLEAKTALEEYLQDILCDREIGDVETVLKCIKIIGGLR